MTDHADLRALVEQWKADVEDLIAMPGENTQMERGYVDALRRAMGDLAALGSQVGRVDR